MGKITAFMNLSLNGFFEGKDHDISWHNVDEEFNQCAIQMLRETDVILFGRRTYQLFESYWPKAAGDPTTSASDLQIAELINHMDKVVFSKTLRKVEEGENWKNVRLLREVDPVELRELKRRYDKNLDVGGNDLLSSFVRLGLIEELRVMLNPVLVGEGSTYLRDTGNRKLKLLEARTLESGNVLLRYEPVS
jgi:dihydrofolate reductase